MAFTFTGFLSLPNELLLTIKGFLDPDDLLENVAYYLLCKRTASCYACVNEDGWLRLLRVNGLGRTTDQWDDMDLYPRSTAIGCARHAWTCEHPGCGKDRLQENRREMAQALLKWPTLGIDDTLPNPYGEAPAPGEAPLVPSTVFEHVAFRTLLSNDEKPRRGGDPPYLRPEDQDLEQTPPDETLEDHPIAARTFACFPPILGMDFEWTEYFTRIHNRAGLVVADVTHIMSIFMKRSLHVEDLFDCFARLNMEAEDIFPEEWTMRDVLSAVSQVRDWFKVVRWTGLRYSSYSGGRRFELKFEPRDLPSHPEFLIGLSRMEFLL